jgi:LytS/YehU family sensor histidine kinase
LWILLGKGLVSLSPSIPPLARLNELYQSQIPLLFGIGILLFLLAVTISYLMIAFENARQAERRSLELRLLAQEAELKALKAQVDPHFLFNSLNSISALTSIDPAGSRRMCLLLSDFLRRSLGFGAQKYISLEEEIALVSAFLAIEQIRLGPRLRINMQIAPQSERCVVPPLLLQPLVENALRHGIMNIVEGGEIRLVSERNAGRLKILVENPQDPDKLPAKGPGIGLENVRRRLRTLYGTEARLDSHRSDTLFRVVLTLPAWTAAEVP